MSQRDRGQFKPSWAVDNDLREYLSHLLFQFGLEKCSCTESHESDHEREKMESLIQWPKPGNHRREGIQGNMTKREQCATSAALSGHVTRNPQSDLMADEVHALYRELIERGKTAEIDKSLDELRKLVLKEGIPETIDAYKVCYLFVSLLLWLTL